MGKIKFTLDFVKSEFEKHGCFLLSEEYIDSKTKLKYLCSCGNVSTIEFRNFRTGKRCNNCHYKRACETIKTKNNGLWHFQTDEFKINRKEQYLLKYGVDNPLKSQNIREKREQTNLSRYGVKHISQNPNCRLNQIKGTRDKYGVDYVMQCPEIYEKFLKTLHEKYNVHSLACLSSSASKESQKLFELINKQIDINIRKKSHYADNGGEYTLKYNKTFFKYDFVNTILMKAIEYNGSKFHPVPEKLDLDEIGWCVFHPNLTVGEAKEYENQKLNALKKRGFDILTVWDFEFHNNPILLINKCVDFLLQKKTGCS